MVAAVDDVILLAADDDVLAVLAVEAIVAAELVAGVDRPEAERLADDHRERQLARVDRALDDAEVAEHQVVARAGVDRVAVNGLRHDAARRGDHAVDDHVDDELAVLAGDDDVVARAGGDVVVAAVLRVGRGDAVDVVRSGVIGHPVDVAAVADDDVVAVAGVDGVGVDAAENDVGASAGGDRIGAADLGLDRLGAAERDRLAAEARRIRPRGDDAGIVAEHQVGTVAGDDRIAAVEAVRHHGARRVGRAGDAGCSRDDGVDHDLAVLAADDDVVA